MPMLDISIPNGALDQTAESTLIAELTDILLSEEGVDPANERGRELAWVFVHRPAEVWVAGQPTREPHYKIVASVPEGQYVRERRERLVARVTTAITTAEPVERTNAAERVWVFAQQVPEGTWGARGEIWGLADIAGHVLGDTAIANEYAPRAIATTRAEHQAVVPSGTEPFQELPTTVPAP